MGPLEGLRIVEIAGVGPAPFAAMLLADMGADVLRIDRRAVIDLGLPDRLEPRFDILSRGRRSVAIDLKTSAGRDLVLRLVQRAQCLIEGFRPGVMERLGLGPDACLAANPALVYGRMTGFGQDGPLAERAGHDINYIAIAGALHGIGTTDGPPVPPLNLVGDFGGGGMFLAFGVVAALHSASRTGRGQVVDAAMVDGSAYLMRMFHGLVAAGRWEDRRQANIIDGAAPWYRTYATRDGKFVAVGAIESRFYQDLVRKLGLAVETLPDQHDRARWPELAARFEAVFLSKTREEWEAEFAGSDACVTPVLTMTEAARHEHNTYRKTFMDRDGVIQAAPAPRFSVTTVEGGSSAGGSPEETAADILAEWGIAADEVDRLARAGVVGRQQE